MSAGLALQYAVIALAVLVSAGVVMQRQFPNATRRLRVACALPLLRDDAPAWRRSVGRWIAPAGNAASKCGSCDSCGPKR
jgi:hypothetical protein